MQPKQIMKKSLLATALIVGLGNAFTASSDPMNVVVGSISDVTSSTPVTTNTVVNFGTGFKPNAAVNDTCSMNGITGLPEAYIQHDQDGDGVDDPVVTATYGALSGAACLTGNGRPMIIEIAGAAGGLVSVSVPTVNDGIVEYTPTAESCIVDYDGTDPVGSKPDDCVSLAAGVLTGVGLWAGAGDRDTDTTADFDYTSKAAGTTRMVLGGQLKIIGDISTATAGSTLNLDVIVTYE